MSNEVTYDAAAQADVLTGQPDDGGTQAAVG